MAGVTYSLADFVTGGPIVDLPIKEGASWAAQLNRADQLSCEIDMRDDDALTLDLKSAATGKKSILLARTDEDVVLAWGLVAGDRIWNEDDRTLSISAAGIDEVWLGNAIVGPAAALTAALLVAGDEPGTLIPNPALDVELDGWSLGTQGKKLLELRLAWPGSPQIFQLPPNQAVPGREQYYAFSDFATIEKRLRDLTNRENGPDFAFDAARSADGLNLTYIMRHGTEEEPRIGSHVGAWNLGGESPITKFRYSDNVDDFGSAVWMSAGKTAGVPLMSRALNDELVSQDGFPPYDVVDKSRSTVERQDTLDDYAHRNAEYVKTPFVYVEFTVRGDAAPGLGAFRPGDTVDVSVPGDHPWIERDLVVRIMSMQGDETGASINVTCEVISS